MPRPHPRARIISALASMSGAAMARDIALEAGIERPEAVQLLIRLRHTGEVFEIVRGTASNLWALNSTTTQTQHKHNHNTKTGSGSQHNSDEVPTP